MYLTYLVGFIPVAAPNSANLQSMFTNIKACIMRINDMSKALITSEAMYTTHDLFVSLNIPGLYAIFVFFLVSAGG